MLAYSLLSCVNIIIINILFGQLSIVNITDRQHPMLLDWLDACIIFLPWFIVVFFVLFSPSSLYTVQATPDVT